MVSRIGAVRREPPTGAEMSSDTSGEDLNLTALCQECDEIACDLEAEGRIEEAAAVAGLSMTTRVLRAIVMDTVRERARVLVFEQDDEDPNGLREMETKGDA